MANKISQVDRRFVSRDKGDNAKGDPTSLAGKISVNDMGSRVSRESSSIAKDSQVVVDDRPRKTRKSTPANPVIGTGDSLEGLKYIPMTPEAREIFGLIMSWVQNLLQDVTHDILVSATDSAITLVKDETISESQKRNEVEDLVGKISDESYSQLLALCKQVPDPDDRDTAMAEMADQDFGIAVTFEENDEDDKIDSEDDEFSDEESQSENEVVNDEVSEDNLEAEPDEIIARPNVQNKSRSKSAEDTASIPAYEIDIFWLQRRLSSIFNDAHLLQEKTNEVFSVLASENSLGQVENELVELFDFQHFDVVKLLCSNRERIVYLTKLAQAEGDDEKAEIRNQIKAAGLLGLLNELDGKTPGEFNSNNKSGLEESTQPEEDVEMSDNVGGLQPRLVDLDDLVFDEGSHVYSGGKLVLPKGTTQFTTKTYEEYDVPPPEKHLGTNDPLIPIEQLPSWAQPAFGSATSLNTIQSKVYSTAFGSEENMLICAPTGAGKTNIALLSMLRAIAEYRDSESGSIDLSAFKMVYIAPLKALVQEQVREFGQRLEPFGIKVGELTGDRNLTKEQIRETQLIVTTPEKWDVVTRKAFDTSYTNLVRLIIIDEIHLLHDERGPVLESIVSRATQGNEKNEEFTRLVGLSATLPNYHDVASFLRVSDSGLFYFDATYRPCPLAQKFVGITEKKAIKRYQAMNDACYDKVMEYAGKHQVIIFVHSRKETAKTARFLRDKALENNTLNLFLRSDPTSQEFLKAEAEQVQNQDLKDLLPTGFAIHHAGLSRADRASSEELFADKRVQVLVCTATLAWGVNLPAHTVIIKGTQVYNPEKGRWAELSPQDVLQMLGRAGRPRYDDSGEGIIITAHSELTYYMSLLNAKLPIESQLMSKLADSLNAEIVLGNITTRSEAVQWLGYTYLYIRMLRNPALYRIGADYDPADKTLVQRRLDLAHSALTELASSGLIKYNITEDVILATELGKIASAFYISHNSMATYNKLLKPHHGPIDLFRIFSLSDEFRFVPVRQEEKLELQKLLEMAPIPIKEAIDEPAAKINILLQSYISRLRLEGFAMVADMICVTQSAGRLFRAIFEICLRKGWARPSRLLLDICKMIERRMWLSNSPFRQFPGCPAEIIKKTETSQMPWSRYLALSDPAEVGQAIRAERYGRQAFQMIKEFPKLQVSVHFHPITRSLLKLELEILAAFEWNKTLHGEAESFLLLVEDGDGEKILFHDQFVLRRRYATDNHIVEFTIPIDEPVSPVIFVSLVSEKWLHSETRTPIKLDTLILPAKFPSFTPVHDLQPVAVEELKIEEYIEIFPWKFFNKIQSQVFHALYDSDKSIFIGASPGNGKRVCASIALLSHWKDQDAGKAVYLSPFPDLLDRVYSNWIAMFKQSNILRSKKLGKLGGTELAADLKVLEQSDLIFCTPWQFDNVTRRWQKRKHVQNIELIIADDLHMLGGFNGAVYEIVLARMRYMAAQTENFMRIVGLSVSLANGKEVGQWLGCSTQTIFNFSPQERTNPIELHLQSFNNPHHPSMMIAMARPAFYALQEVKGQSIIFVNDHQQCIDTTDDLIRLARGELGNANYFASAKLEQAQKYLDQIKEATLKFALQHGIGHLYNSMDKRDRRVVEGLYEQGVIRVILITQECCHSVPPGNSSLVVILGTQIYEGSEHRYVDYPISYLLEMVGFCGSEADSMVMGRCLVLTNTSKKEYYRKFLTEALPVESHLHGYLHDGFLGEISVGVIESPDDAIDWLTYSYFYRRLQMNPSYYGLPMVSDEGVSEYLSELVETTLKDLVDANLIEEDDEDMSITPSNGARIASYYGISFMTMQTFMLSLSGKSKLGSILEIVTSASEFESLIPIRNHEDRLLMQIYGRVPIKSASVNYGSPRFKAFILLQAHLSRFTLPADLASDQKVVIEKIISLLAAAVDVLSMDAHLNAMYAMDLSQMVVQAMWDRDSPLKQIPYFTTEVIERCKAAKIENVYDFMGIEDDDVRNELLQMDEEDPRMNAIADFVNNYPSVDIGEYQIDEGSLFAGSESSVVVTLNREMDEDTDTVVRSRYFPFPKSESWWLVIGNSVKRELYGIKRIAITDAEKAVDLRFIIPESGPQKLSIWLTSDSYLDVDKEIELNLTVLEAQEEEDEEEEN